MNGMLGIPLRGEAHILTILAEQYLTNLMWWRLLCWVLGAGVHLGFLIHTYTFFRKTSMLLCIFFNTSRPLILLNIKLSRERPFQTIFFVTMLTKINLKPPHPPFKELY